MFLASKSSLRDGIFSSRAGRVNILQFLLESGLCMKNRLVFRFHGKSVDRKAAAIMPGFESDFHVVA